MGEKERERAREGGRLERGRGRESGGIARIVPVKLSKFQVAASKMSTETLRHGRERGRERKRRREGGI